MSQEITLFEDIQQLLSIEVLFIIDQITKSLSSVTDIQGQFNKQLLSALLGRRVNLLEVNRLKLSGDIGEIAKLTNNFQIYR